MTPSVSRMGKVKRRSHWPNGGYVTDPALSAQNLMDAAKQHGAKVRLGAEVAEILKGRSRSRCPPRRR